MLLLVIAAITTLTALLFSGSLRKTVPLTVVSDRAGLVMEDGAKVKMRGVQIGEVTSIGAEHVGGTEPVHPQAQDRPGTVRVPAEQRRGRDQVQHRLRRQIRRPRRTVRRGQWAPGPRRGPALAQRHRRGQHRLREPAVGGALHRPGEAQLGVHRGRRSRSRQGRADRTGDHRRQRHPAGGQPAHAHRAAGLAVVRPDRPGVFRCRTEHPVHPRLVHHHQRDDHLQRRCAGQPAAVRRRVLPVRASTPSAATSPPWCGR